MPRSVGSRERTSFHLSCSIKGAAGREVTSVDPIDHVELASDPAALGNCIGRIALGAPDKLLASLRD